MTSGQTADAAQDALGHLRHARAVLASDEAQMPLNRADAELSDSEVAQAREDLPIQAISVGLHCRRAEVLEACEPRLGQDTHACVRSDVPADVEPSAVSKSEPQRCLSGSLGLGVSLDLTALAVVVAIPGDGAMP